MKRIVFLLLIVCTLTARAQKFVCGKAETGSTQLTTTSVYSATTPGFAPEKPDPQTTFNLPVTSVPPKTTDVMKASRG
jgi:hypothetical protein